MRRIEAPISSAIHIVLSPTLRRSPDVLRRATRPAGPFSPPSSSTAEVRSSRTATRRRPRPSPQACGMRSLPTARRAYEAAWQRFQEWTAAAGHRSLPAAPQTVALHLGRLAASGRAMATIELARAAISHAHAAAGIAKGDNPARPSGSWPRRSRVGGIRPQHPGRPRALTTAALARVRETARLPRRGRGGRMESADVAQAGLRLTWQSSASWRTGAEAVGGCRPGLGRRRMVGGRHGPHHGPEGEEPAGPGDSGGHRGHRPRPARHSARRRRSRRAGVRPDRRGPGQPGASRRSSRRPG